MKHHLQKIIQAIQKRRSSPFVIGVVATLFVWVVGGIFLYFVTKPSVPKETKLETAAVEDAVVGLRRALDGVPVEDGFTEPPVYTVMIDNLIEARPQSALFKAHLVFELPVESGITRLMAVYLGGDSMAKIGPVRSARPYFIDYASEFGALYVHVGGSPEALQALSKTSAVTNIDEFGNGKYFFRAKDRYAPHNVYTTSILMEQALTAKGLTSAAYPSWIFRDETRLEERVGAAGVKIAFSTPAYEVEWRFDKTQNEYVRYQGRTKYRDQDGSEVRAKNVGVVVTESKVQDGAGRRELRTIGEGEGYVIAEGRIIRGTWKKPSASERLRFYDSEGGEIALLAGVTWIEVVNDPAMVKLTE